MTLFVATPKRVLAINDAYIIVLTFLISFAVGKIVKAVIEKQKQQNRINMANPRGGNIGFEVSDDTELAQTILTCIADNERYLVKDPKLTQMIFTLVKAKIKNESLVLTPNMMRFLALKLINNDQTFIVKIGNILVSSNNQARLLARVSGTVVIGFVGALFSTFAYAVLMMLVYFDTTENCGYKCSDYFEQLPKEGPVKIYEKESTGRLFIAGNDDARQIDIYIPSEAADKVTISSSNGKLKTTRTYTKVPKKATEVKFSEFRKTDPVLSRFKNLEEPEIPQKNCPITDVHDVLNMRVD